jgi:biopolymer transport protein ExbB
VSWQRIIEANGPFFLSVFVVLFLASFTLIFWRWLLNRAAKTDLADLVRRLKDDLGAGRWDDAVNLCEEESGVVAKVFKTALDASPQGKTAVRNGMADKIELEIVPDLNFLLPWILVLAKLSPMVGLLGTVWGMINAFGKIAGAVKVDPSSLAGDIGMALFTTAEGLLIAIPLIRLAAGRPGGAAHVSHDGRAAGRAGPASARVKARREGAPGESLWPGKRCT